MNSGYQSSLLSKFRGTFYRPLTMTRDLFDNLFPSDTHEHRSDIYRRKELPIREASCGD